MAYSTIDRLLISYENNNIHNINWYLEWRGKHEMRTTYERKGCGQCIVHACICPEFQHALLCNASW